MDCFASLAMTTHQRKGLSEKPIGYDVCCLHLLFGVTGNRSKNLNQLARSCRGRQFLFAGPKRNQKGPWGTKPPPRRGTMAYHHCNQFGVSDASDWLVTSLPPGVYARRNSPQDYFCFKNSASLVFEKCVVAPLVPSRRSRRRFAPQSSLTQSPSLHHHRLAAGWNCCSHITKW